MFKIPFSDLEQAFVDNKRYCNDLLKGNNSDYELYGTQITISYADRISIFLSEFNTITEKIQNYILQDMSEKEIIRKILISLINKEFGNFEIEKVLKLSIAIIISITSKSKIDYPYEILDIDYDKSTKTVKLILKPLITFLNYKSIVLIFSGLSYLLEELHVNEVFQYKSEEIELILKYLNKLEASSLWNKEELIYQFLIRLNFYLDSTIEGSSNSIITLMYVLKAVFFEIDYFHDICNFFALNRWNVLFNQKKKYFFSKTMKEGAFLHSTKEFYPVFSSIESTGFRIVVGEARNIGFGTIAVNESLPLLLKCLSVGDQIQLKFPFDKYQVQLNSSINGPFVQLLDKSCVRINTAHDFQKYESQIDKIVTFGDLLISSLDVPRTFSRKNYAKNHFSWVKSALSHFSKFSIETVTLLSSIFDEKSIFKDTDLYVTQLKDFLINNKKEITAYRSVELFKNFGIAIHPDYSPKWSKVTNKDWRLFRTWIRKTRYKEITTNSIKKHQIIGEFDENAWKLLKQGAIDFLIENDKIIIEEYGSILYYIFLDKSTDIGELEPGENVFEPIVLLNNSNKIKFDVEENERVNFALNNINTVYLDSIREGINGFSVEPVTSDEENFIKSKIAEFDSHLSLADIHFFQGNFQISDEIRNEILEKTILRAKYKLPIFKDGLVHFSVINSPLTVFKPKEINTSIDELRLLGYYYDIDGNKIISTEQDILLKSGDVIVPEAIIKDLLSVMSFLNDELKYIFNKRAFYNLEAKKKSILGLKVIGINKNYSVGIYGRIIGNSSSPVLYATPAWHMSKGSYCNGEMTDSFVLDLDCFLNLDLSLIVSKVGMFRGIPVFTQIEPDLDIAGFVLDKVLAESGLNNEELFSSFDNTNINTSFIKKIVDYNLYNKNRSYYDVNKIVPYDTKNILNGIIDPIEKLDTILTVLDFLEPLNKEEYYNKSIKDYIKGFIIPEIENFFKNPFICSRCGTKNDFLINGKCISCQKVMEISENLIPIKNKLDQLQNFINKFDNLPVQPSTKNLLEYSYLQLKPIN